MSMSLITNTTKFIYDTVLDFTWPAFEIFNQVRPIILLPFNVWFFFVSMPFRVFFFFMNGFKFQSSPVKTLQLKERTVVMNRPVEVTQEKKTIVVPAIIVSKASPPQIRQRKAVVSEDSPFSWYSVSAIVKEEPIVRSETILQEFATKLEEIKLKKEEIMPKEIVADESAELKAQLAEFERREMAATEEKQRLEAQLDQLASKFNSSQNSITMEKQRLEVLIKDLTGKFASDEKAAAEEKRELEAQLMDLTEKFNVDEKALASFEQDRARFRERITVQQKKSFDFQQDIIALKNQLKAEQASRLQAQEELNSIKQAKKAPKAKKAAKSESSAQTDVVALPKALVSETSVTKAIPVPQVAAAKPAWNVQHHENDYTEMVAAAAAEERDHKSFVEVVKESLEVVSEEKEVAAVEEFTVVGGDLSSKHIVLNTESTADREIEEPTPVVEEKEVTVAKPAWIVPHHEKDYTEMVAAAAVEEREHKSFSDVVKESLEVVSDEEADTVEEFTVVGGDLSTKHILLNSAPTIAASN